MTNMFKETEEEKKTECLNEEIESLSKEAEDMITK